MKIQVTAALLGLALATPAFADVPVADVPVHVDDMAVTSPLHRQPLNFPFAVGLTYGMPFAIGAVGGLLVAPLGGNPAVTTALGVPFQLVALASLGSGYAYAGEPGRGALSVLGQVTALSVGLVVSGEVAYALWGDSQSAGFGLPLVGIPVMTVAMVGYNAWMLQDLKGVIDSKNLSAGN